MTSIQSSIMKFATAAKKPLGMDIKAKEVYKNTSTQVPAAHPRSKAVVISKANPKPPGKTIHVKA